MCAVVAMEVVVAAAAAGYLLNVCEHWTTHHTPTTDTDCIQSLMGMRHSVLLHAVQLEVYAIHHTLCGKDRIGSVEPVYGHLVHINV